MKLKRRQLKYVIRESIVKGRDFNDCLLEALLMELNYAGLATRAEKQGYSLIIHEMGGKDFVIVIEPRKGKELPKAVAAAVGMSDTEVGGGWWRLQNLYSDSPTALPLALVSALSYHEKILADKSVSPAAKSVIKGYYEKVSKSSPDLIEDDADTWRIEQGQEEEEPWLRAGYFPPSGSDAVARRSRLNGEDLVEEIAEEEGIDPDEVRNRFAEAAKAGFKTAYSSEKRTGFENVPPESKEELEKAMKSRDVAKISRVLYTGAKPKKKGSKPWTASWVEENFDDLVEILAKSAENIRSKSELGELKYMNDLIEAVFNSIGKSGIVILNAAIEKLENKNPRAAEKFLSMLESM